MPDAPMIGPVAAPELHVMTFNIRRRMPHVLASNPDRWADRKHLVRRLLQAEMPTIVGVQEALLDQARWVHESLGSTYNMIGYGRDPNRTGEGCPLYYDSERLELLDWVQQALSDTPQKPGSTTWGNRTPRMVVRAVFRDRMTGVQFVALNTHLDNRSHDSRIRSVEMVRGLVASAPLAVLTGDFNTDVDADPYGALVGDGSLVDAWKSARLRVSKSWGTFPNYRDPQHNRKRIDWIITTPGVAVDRIGVNIARYEGRWPSDHTPVQAVVRFPVP